LSARSLDDAETPGGAACVETPSRGYARRTRTKESVVDDKLEGKKKQAEGKVQEAWGDLKDKTGDAWDDAKDTLDDLRDRDDEDDDLERGDKAADRPA
jgi:uncharacterized protein YjbJ (UPF0337 family)